MPEPTGPRDVIPQIRYRKGTMKDWTSIAKALELGIPAADAGRITQPLNALEEAFRPLVQGLTPDVEPAPVFRADEDRS